MKTAVINFLQNLIKKSMPDRSSRPEVFLGKSVLEICSKFTGEHPCRTVISIKSHLCMSVLL